MNASRAAQIGQRLPQSVRRSSGEHILEVDASGIKAIAGQEQLPTPGVIAKPDECPSQGDGDPGMAGGVGGIGIVAAGKRQHRELDQHRCGFAGITLEIGHGRHRIVIEIENSGGEERIERGFGQIECGDRLQQRRSKRITGVLVMGDCIAPPLQPDLAQRGLTDGVADLCDLGIESMQCNQMAPHRFRREKIGDEAILVALAQPRRGVLISIHQIEIGHISRSVHRDQRSGHLAIFRQEDIERPNRCAGGHCIGRDSSVAEFAGEFRDQALRGGAGADQ